MSCNIPSSWTLALYSGNKDPQGTADFARPRPRGIIIITSQTEIAFPIDRRQLNGRPLVIVRQGAQHQASCTAWGLAVDTMKPGQLEQNICTATWTLNAYKDHISARRCCNKTPHAGKYTVSSRKHELPPAPERALIDESSHALIDESSSIIHLA